MVRNVDSLYIPPTLAEAKKIDVSPRGTRPPLPSADILVVDDNSPDGTADIAEAAAAELGSIDVLRRPVKQGLGSAYRAGFAIGLEKGYETLVQIDADLSHDPAVLPELLGALESGADLAIGSRYVPGGEIPHWPWFRRALSRYGNLYAAFVLGTGVKDATSGYRAYRADTLKSIDYATTRSKGYGFQIETEYRVHSWGGRITEVPIVFTDRVRGYSKMSWFIFAEELLLVTWWGMRDRARRLWRRRRPG